MTELSQQVLHTHLLVEAQCRVTKLSQQMQKEWTKLCDLVTSEGHLLLTNRQDWVLECEILARQAVWTVPDQRFDVLLQTLSKRARRIRHRGFYVLLLTLQQLRKCARSARRARVTLPPWVVARA